MWRLLHMQPGALVAGCHHRLEAHTSCWLDPSGLWLLCGDHVMMPWVHILGVFTSTCTYLHLPASPWASPHPSSLPFTTLTSLHLSAPPWTTLHHPTVHCFTMQHNLVTFDKTSSTIKAFLKVGQVRIVCFFLLLIKSTRGRHFVNLSLTISPILTKTNK